MATLKEIKDLRAKQEAELRNLEASLDLTAEVKSFADELETAVKTFQILREDFPKSVEHISADERVKAALQILKGIKPTKGPKGTRGKFDLEKTIEALGTGAMWVNELATKLGVGKQTLTAKLKSSAESFEIYKEDPNNKLSKVFVKVKTAAPAKRKK